MGTPNTQDIKIPVPVLLNSLEYAENHSAPSHSQSTITSSRGHQTRLHKTLRIADIVLRFLTLSLLVIALSLMLTSSQKEEISYFGFRFTLHLNWSYVEPFKFQVVATALMAVYTLFQSSLSVATLVQSVSSTRNITWIICTTDQVATYVLLSAAAAAAGAASINKYGVHDLDLPRLCQLLDKFCIHSTVSIVSTILASFFSACCVAVDVYILSSALEKC